MKVFSRKSFSVRRGFTLVEVLIAVAITALLSALLVSITAEVLRIWSRSSNTLTTNSQARIALDIVERDLQSAIFRADGRQWFASGTAPGGWDPAPPEVDVFRLNGQPLRNDYLAFFSAGPEGISTVLYRLIAQPLVPGGTQEFFQLVRTELSARHTLRTRFDLAGTVWSAAFPFGLEEMILKGAIDNDDYTGEVGNPEALVITRDIIATNVIGFRADLFPSATEPREIEVELVVLSNDGWQGVNVLLDGRRLPPPGETLEQAVENLLRREAFVYRKVIYPHFEIVP